MTGSTGERQVSPVRDFISLTKPRIISLLLVTTVAPMYVAGVPSVLTVLIVMLGGYLMAGGSPSAHTPSSRARPSSGRCDARTRSLRWWSNVG